MRTYSLSGIALLLLAAAAIAEESTSQPAVEWGQAKAGLRLSLEIAGDVRWGGELPIHVRLQNVGSEAAKLPAPLREPNKAFGWLLVQQGAGRDATQYFSERLTVGKDVKVWPAELAGETVIDVWRRGVGKAKLYSYRKGVEFLDAYKAGKAPDDKSLGAATTALQLGPTAVMACLYIEAGERPTILKSNLVTFELLPPELDKLADADRKTFVADLLKQFDRDPWAAKTAHDAAIKLGKAILSELIEAVNQRKRPGYSRMWLATAVADIRDPRAAKALVELLQDTNGGVRTVVGYHGPKQHSDALDAAIVKRAKELNESGFTAYSLLGFVAFGKAAPEELLQLGLDSDDPRVRTAAARTMTKLAGNAPVTRLTELLKDPEPRVRAQAARMLTYFNKNMPPATLGAMVQALALDGDIARVRICDALSALTGQNRPYDANASAEQKQSTIEFWQAWWEGQKEK